MAASPETDALLSIGDTYSSPSTPSSPVLPPSQENSPLTTAAPPEPVHIEITTPAPPPHPERDTAGYSDLDESLPPTDGGNQAPSLPPLEVAPAASPALEASSPEKPTSPPSRAPDAPVELLPDVVVSAASPPPSPQIAQAQPLDAPPPVSPSPPSTPPTTISPHAALDLSATEAGAMASQEAASPPPASEPASHSMLAPLTPPLESGPEGLSLQKHPRPEAQDVTPQVCENSEATGSLPPQAGSTYVSLDAVADEVVEVASTEAAGSPPALDLEGMDGNVPSAFKHGLEGELSQQKLRSPRSESVPPRFENSEPAELPQLPPPPAASKYCSLESAVNEVAAVASEEAAGSPHTVDAKGVEVALESQSEGSLQEPMHTSPSPKMGAEPCSPDMEPPGFENFKSKWLPPSAPTLPVESTQYSVEMPAPDTACVMPEAAARSLPALETIDVKMGIPPGQLPSSRDAEDGPFIKSASSLIIEAAPCSPDMPPPGFENFKQSWLQQPSVPPSSETTYSPDVATTNEELVRKACSVPALDTTDIETGIDRNLLPTLQSEAGGLLQGQKPSSPSPKIQVASCSPYIMPPEFASSTLPQLQLSSPVAWTSHKLQDSVATKAVCLTSEDAPQPSPVLEAMTAQMDAAPALPTSLESGAQESMQQELSRMPPCTVQGTTCSLAMVSSGSDKMESLANAAITTVTAEAVVDPLSEAEAIEGAKGHILPPPLENGCDGPLPRLDAKASSLVVQAVPSSPAITRTGFESLESSEQTSSRLAERIESPSHLPVTNSVIVKSDEMAQPQSPLQSTDTDMENAPVQQSPSKSEEKSLSHPQHQPSLSSGKYVPCSPDIAPPGYENFDSSEELTPLPPLCPNFELGQMVCGGCRELIAYPRGEIHVQCFCCWTINLVVEANQVGKVYCGQCETLLMYPFGAPAVRCSTCLFVTEIGERNVRPRMSVEQGTPPHQQELVRPKMSGTGDTASPTRARSGLTGLDHVTCMAL